MSSMWLSKHRIFRGLISLTALFTFVTCVVLADAWAAVDGIELPYTLSSAEKNNYANLDIETFTIPSHLGEIKYSFKGEKDLFVIHLQDAHCNCNAQRKISGIIDYLNKEYGVKMVNLEGGVGEYDLSIFTAISGNAIRTEVAEYFVKKGEINGAELYAINNPERISLWGVEDKELYMANLKVYRDSLKYKKKVDEYLGQLDRHLNQLKRHIYDTRLIKIDISYNAYKAGNMQFREYLEFLLDEAGKSGIDVKDYNNLYLLEQAMGQEDGIDYDKANMERNTLVEDLKGSLSKNEVRELISKSIDFKTKKISRKAFYTYLLDKAGELGLDAGKHRALSEYIVYVTTYEAVDRSKVMGEMDALEAAIKDTLYKDERQRELNGLSRSLALMGNIFDIKLTKTDYRYYLDNESAFGVSRFVNFIEKEAPGYRVDVELSPDIRDLDGYREDITKFYEYSFRRDEVFLKNMRYTQASGTTKSAILMTGGFHTENLCDLLEQEGISYISILPKFTNGKGYTNPYFDILAGQTTNLQIMLASVMARTAMMQVASLLNPVLADAVYGKEDVSAFKVAVQLLAALGRMGIDPATVEIENIYLEEGDRIGVACGGREPVEMSLNDLLARAGYGRRVPVTPDVEIDDALLLENFEVLDLDTQVDWEGPMAELAGRLRGDIGEYFKGPSEAFPVGLRSVVVKKIEYDRSGEQKHVFRVEAETIDNNGGQDTVVFGLRLHRPGMVVLPRGTVEAMAEAEVEKFRRLRVLDGVAIFIKRLIHIRRMRELGILKRGEALDGFLEEQRIYSVSIGEYSDGEALDLIKDPELRERAYVMAVNTAVRGWLLTFRDGTGAAINDMKGANFVYNPETKFEWQEPVVYIDLGFGQDYRMGELLDRLKAFLRFSEVYEYRERMEKGSGKRWISRTLVEGVEEAIENFFKIEYKRSEDDPERIKELDVLQAQVAAYMPSLENIKESILRGQEDVDWLILDRVVPPSAPEEGKATIPFLKGLLRPIFALRGITGAEFDDKYALQVAPLVEEFIFTFMPLFLLGHQQPFWLALLFAGAFVVSHAFEEPGRPRTPAKRLEDIKKSAKVSAVVVIGQALLYFAMNNATSSIAVLIPFIGWVLAYYFHREMNRVAKGSTTLKRVLAKLAFVGLIFAVFNMGFKATPAVAGEPEVPRAAVTRTDAGFASPEASIATGLSMIIAAVLVPLILRLGRLPVIGGSPVATTVIYAALAAAFSFVAILGIIRTARQWKRFNWKDRVNMSVVTGFAALMFTYLFFNAIPLSSISAKIQQFRAREPAPVVETETEEERLERLGFKTVRIVNEYKAIYPRDQYDALLEDFARTVLGENNEELIKADEALERAQSDLLKAEGRLGAAATEEERQAALEKIEKAIQDMEAARRQFDLIVDSIFWAVNNSMVSSAREVRGFSFESVLDKKNRRGFPRIECRSAFHANPRDPANLSVYHWEIYIDTMGITGERLERLEDRKQRVKDRLALGLAGKTTDPTRTSEDDHGAIWWCSPKALKARGIVEERPRWWVDALREGRIREIYVGGTNHVFAAPVPKPGAGSWMDPEKFPEWARGAWLIESGISLGLGAALLLAGVSPLVVPLAAMAVFILPHLRLDRKNKFLVKGASWSSVLILAVGTGIASWAALVNPLRGIIWIALLLIFHRALNRAHMDAMDYRAGRRILEGRARAAPAASGAVAEREEESPEEELVLRIFSDLEPLTARKLEAGKSNLEVELVISGRPGESRANLVKGEEAGLTDNERVNVQNHLERLLSGDTLKGEEGIAEDLAGSVGGATLRIRFTDSPGVSRAGNILEVPRSLFKSRAALRFMLLGTFAHPGPGSDESVEYFRSLPWRDQDEIIHYFGRIYDMTGAAGDLRTLERLTEVNQTKYILDPENLDRLIEQLSANSVLIDPQGSNGDFSEVYKEMRGILDRILLSQGFDPGLYELHLFDDLTANACVLRYSNHVFFNIGVLRLLKDNGRLSRDAVAFVMAHEITHLIQGRNDVDSGRIDQKLRRSDTLEGHVKARKEGYVDEYDADYKAIEILERAGYRVAEATTAFELMAAEMEKKGKRSGLTILIEATFGTHPELVERIRKIKEEFPKKQFDNFLKPPEMFSDEAVRQLGTRTVEREFENAIFRCESISDMLALLERARDPRDIQLIIKAGIPLILYKESRRIAQAIYDGLTPEEKKSLAAIKDVRQRNILFGHETKGTGFDREVTDRSPAAGFQDYSRGDEKLEDFSDPVLFLQKAVFSYLRGYIVDPEAGSPEIRVTKPSYESPGRRSRKDKRNFDRVAGAALPRVGEAVSREGGGITRGLKGLYERAAALDTGEGLVSSGISFEDYSVYLATGVYPFKVRPKEKYGTVLGAYEAGEGEEVDFILRQPARRITPESSPEEFMEFISYDTFPKIGQVDGSVPANLRTKANYSLRKWVDVTADQQEALAKAWLDKEEGRPRNVNVRKLSIEQLLLVRRWLIHNGLGEWRVTGILLEKIFSLPMDEFANYRDLSIQLLESATGHFSLEESFFEKFRDDPTFRGMISQLLMSGKSPDFNDKFSDGLGGLLKWGKNDLSYMGLGVGFKEDLDTILKMLPGMTERMLGWQVILPLADKYGLSDWEKLKAVERGVAIMDARRKESGKRKPLEKDQLSKLLEHFLTYFKEKDEPFIRDDVRSFFAGYGVEGASLDRLSLNAVKLLYYFKAGGLLSYGELKEAFHKLAEEDGMGYDELYTFYRCLRSLKDRMLGRGVPVTMDAEETEALKKELDIEGRAGYLPGEKITIMFTPRTWDEFMVYIGQYLLFAQGRPSDASGKPTTSEEIEGLELLDPRISPYKAFFGEIDMGLSSTTVIEGLGKLDSYVKPHILRDLLESVLGMYKRISRHNMLPIPPDEFHAIFGYIRYSEKDFEGLLQELLDLLPPSVYRNYALYYLFIYKALEPAAGTRLTGDKVFDAAIVRKLIDSSDGRQELKSRLRRVREHMVGDKRVEFLNTVLFLNRSERVNSLYQAFKARDDDLVEKPLRRTGLLLVAKVWLPLSVAVKLWLNSLIFRLSRGKLDRNRIILLMALKKINGWPIFMVDVFSDIGHDIDSISKYLSGRSSEKDKYKDESEEDLRNRLRTFYRIYYLQQVARLKLEGEIFFNRFFLSWMNNIPLLRRFLLRRTEGIEFTEPGGLSSQLDILLSEAAETDWDGEVSDRSRSWNEKLREVILVNFPRPSNTRDKLLKTLLDTHFEEMSASEILEVTGHFNQAWARDNVRLRALEKDRQDNPEDFATFEQEFAKISVEYFPEYGYMRDDLLLQLADEKVTTPEQYAVLADKLLVSQDNLLKKSVQDRLFWGDKFKRMVQNMDARDKAEFLLWVFGAMKDKPKLISMMEVDLEIDLDSLKEVFRSSHEGHYEMVGDSVRKDLFPTFFYGKEGVFTDPMAEKYFLDTLFDELIPEEVKNRRIYKEIWGSVFANVDVDRKITIMINLAKALSEINIEDGVDAEEEGKVIKAFLESCGVMGIKLGQMLNSLGVEGTSELTGSASPIVKGTAFSILQKIYGDFEGHFAGLRKPLGSASIKMVYMGVKEGPDGQELVAVKLKKPEIEQRIREDIQLLKKILADLRASGVLNIPKNLEEKLESLVRDELNFYLEWQNQKDLNASVRDFIEIEGELTPGTSEEFVTEVTGGKEAPAFLVPAIMERLKGAGAGQEAVEEDAYEVRIESPVAEEVLGTRGGSVMVEPVAKGIALKDIEEKGKGDLTGEELAAVKRKVAKMLLFQMFGTGVFHADLHKGNLFIERDSEKPGSFTATVIDMGSVGRMPTVQEGKDFVSVFIALSLNSVRHWALRVPVLGQIYWRMRLYPVAFRMIMSVLAPYNEDSDQDSLAEEIRVFLEEDRSGDDKTASLQKLFARLDARGFVVPGSFLELSKAWVSATPLFKDADGNDLLGPDETLGLIESAIRHREGKEGRLKEAAGIEPLGDIVPAGARDVSPGVTKWLEDRTKWMPGWARALFAAPVTEEILYRALPLVAVSILSFIVTGGFDLSQVVLGTVILQVFFGAKFVKDHYRGERGPPAVTRRFAAPVVVTLINALVLPLIVSNPLAFLGLAILVHFSVNLSVLALNRLFPALRLAFAAIQGRRRIIIRKKAAPGAAVNIPQTNLSNLSRERQLRVINTILARGIHSMNAEELERNFSEWWRMVFPQSPVPLKAAYKDNTREDGNPVMLPKELTGPATGLTYDFGKERVLGVGGFGSVYQARAFDRSGKYRGDAAVKVLTPVPEGAGEEARREHLEYAMMFLREYLIMRKLRMEGAEGSLKAFEAGSYVVDGKRYYYIVEELSREGNLADILESGYRFTEAEARRLGRYILRAVRELHQRGILHLDLKPGNIFIERDAEGRISGVKLGDFGISVYSPTGQYQTIDGIQGSYMFLPGRSIVDSLYGQKNDLYAVGAIMFEVMHGALPYRQPDVETFMDWYYNDEGRLNNWLEERRGHAERLLERPNMPVEAFIGALWYEGEEGITSASEAYDELVLTPNTEEYNGIFTDDERRYIAAMAAFTDAMDRKASEYDISDEVAGVRTRLRPGDAVIVPSFRGGETVRVVTRSSPAKIEFLALKEGAVTTETVRAQLIMDYLRRGRASAFRVDSADAGAAMDIFFSEETPSVTSDLARMYVERKTRAGNDFSRMHSMFMALAAMEMEGSPVPGYRKLSARFPADMLAEKDIALLYVSDGRTFGEAADMVGSKGAVKYEYEMPSKPVIYEYEEGSMTQTIELTEAAAVADRTIGPGVTRWLEDRTPWMPTWMRALIAAPLTEEIMYRGLPLIAVSFLSFIVTGGFDLSQVVLGTVILQAFFGAKFVKDHYRGERGPPAVSRRFAAPVLVTLINALVLPLLVSNPLAFLGLAILVHFSVNLSVLALNRLYPALSLAFAAIAAKGTGISVWLRRTLSMADFEDLGPVSTKNIGTFPMRIYQDRDTGEKFLIKKAPDHSMRSELIGQRIFERAGLPVPKMRLAEIDGETVLLVEYLEGYGEADGNSLPEGFEKNKRLQAGLLLDLLIYNYDRTPWNMMYKGGTFAFIDFGASVISRAQGKYKGFSPEVTDDQVEAIWKNNPQYPGTPVNAAYARAMDTSSGLDPMIAAMTRLFNLSEDQIREIVDEAYAGITPEQMRKNNDERIARLQADPSLESDKYTSALETFVEIRDKWGGDEKAYVADTLIRRREAILKKFGHTVLDKYLAEHTGFDLKKGFELVPSKKFFLQKPSPSTLKQLLHTGVTKTTGKDTNPPENSMDVTDDYDVGMAPPERLMDDEEISRQMDAKVRELEAENPEEADKLRAAASMIKTRLKGGKFSEFLVLARVMAAIIGKIRKDEPDRFIVHFARDMGLTWIVQNALAQLDQEEGRPPGGALYLNTPMMGGVYLSLNSLVSGVKKEGVEQTKKDVEEWFERGMAEPGDTPFKKLARATYESMKKMGALERDKILLLDTGYVGTMPWYVYGLLRYFDRQEGRPERDLEILLIKSRASARQVGAEDLDEEDRDLFENQPGLMGMLGDNYKMLGLLEKTGNRYWHPVRFDKNGRRIVPESPRHRLYFHLLGLLFLNMAVAQHMHEAGVDIAEEAKRLGIDLPKLPDISDYIDFSGGIKEMDMKDIKSIGDRIQDVDSLLSQYLKGLEIPKFDLNQFQKIADDFSQSFKDVKASIELNDFLSAMAKKNQDFGFHDIPEPLVFPEGMAPDLKNMAWVKEPVEFKFDNVTLRQSLAKLDLSKLIKVQRTFFPKIKPFGFTGLLVFLCGSLAAGVLAAFGLIGPDLAVSLIKDAAIAGSLLAVAAFAYRGFLSRVKNGDIIDMRFWTVNDPDLAGRVTASFRKDGVTDNTGVLIVDDIQDMSTEDFRRLIDARTDLDDAQKRLSAGLFDISGMWFDEGNNILYLKSRGPLYASNLFTRNNVYVNNALYDKGTDRIFVHRNAARSSELGFGLVMAHERGKRDFLNSRLLTRLFGWKVAELVGSLYELWFLLTYRFRLPTLRGMLTGTSGSVLMAALVFPVLSMFTSAFLTPFSLVYFYILSAVIVPLARLALEIRIMAAWAWSRIKGFFTVRAARTPGELRKRSFLRNMLIWMLSFAVSGLIHFLAFLALNRSVEGPPSGMRGPGIEERGPPAVKAGETKIAAGVAFAAGIAGIIAGLAVASPILLAAAGYIFLATFPLVAQAVKAQRVQREKAVDRAAAPEDTFAQIQAKFGPVIGPLVFIHELVHRATGRLGIGKLGRSGRVLDEGLAYAVEYAVALPVIALAALSLGMRILFVAITSRAARAPPAPSAEPLIVAAPAEGVVVRSALTPATRVRSGIELQPEEIEALVERMTGQMQHVVSMHPSFLESSLNNMGVVCPVGQMDVIEVSYRAHGINKDVFRVDITKKDGTKIQFTLALKTEREEDAVLFEEGELEAQEKLQGTGLVPRLGGVFHIEKTDKGYGGVSWEQPEGRKKDFTTIAIEEFIEGPTAAELLDENDELDADTRAKAVTAWMRIFFALNGIRTEGSFSAPYDIHMNNVIVNENSSDKSIVAIDLGRQKQYYRLDQYLSVVLYHYADEAAAALSVLPALWPDIDWNKALEQVKRYVQGIEKTYFSGEESPEKLAERKIRLDDISWTKADIDRILSAASNYSAGPERAAKPAEPPAEVQAGEEAVEAELEPPARESGLDLLRRTMDEYDLHPADLVEVMSGYKNSKGQLGDLSKWVVRNIRPETVLSEDKEGIIRRIAEYPDIEKISDTVWGRIDLNLIPVNARNNIHKRIAGLISKLEREINRVIGDERLANSHMALLLKVKRLNDTRALSDSEKEEALQELLSVSTDALMSEEALALVRDELIWFIKNAKNRHKLMAVNVAREFGLLRPRRTLNLGERYKAKGGIDKPIMIAITNELGIDKSEILFIEEASSEIPVEMPGEDSAEFEMDVEALEVTKILPRNIYWQYLYNTPAEREEFIKRIRNLSGLTGFIKEHFKELYPKAEVVSIIVFGSYMYPLGKEVRASDVDIAVVVDGDVTQEELWRQKTHLFKIALPETVFSEEARASGNVVEVADITPLHIRDFSDPEARNPHGPFWLAYANRFGTGVPLYLRDGASNDPFMREPTHGSLLAKSVELIDKGMFKYAEQLQNHPRTACSKLVKRTIEAIALLHIIDRTLVEEDFFVEYQNLFKEYLEGEEIEEVRREEFTRRFFELLTRDASRLIGWAEHRATDTGRISREDALKFSSIMKRRIRDMAFLFGLPVPDGFTPAPENEPFIMALQNKLAATGEIMEAAEADLRSLFTAQMRGEDIYYIFKRLAVSGGALGRLADKVGARFKEIRPEAIEKEKLMDFLAAQGEIAELTPEDVERLQDEINIAGKERALREAGAQVEAAKGVIGDLRQDNPDLIVMPGSEFFIAQQEPVIRSTSRKLHRDYGQETLPYSYKYGEDWKDNLLLLMEERVVPAFEKEREAKKDPRMLLYLPITQDEREKIFDKGGLLEKYAHLAEFITVVIESDIPANGMIDNVMHIVLAKALLNYQRFEKGTYSRAAADRVLGLVGTVTEPGSIDLAKYGENPEQLIKDIINGLVILRIRKIDFTELQEWKRTQDAVLRAL